MPDLPAETRLSATILLIRDADEALRCAKRDSIVTLLPVLNKDAEDEIWLEIPESAGDDTVRAPISAPVGGSPGNGDKS